MRLILLSLIFVLGSLKTVVAQTQNRSDLEKQREDIQREIAEVKQSLDMTKKNKKASLGQLALLQKKLKLREAAIGNINHQIDFIQNDIGRSRGEINKLKKDLDTLKIQYEKSVVYAYRNRSNYDFLNFIFSASSFNDALKRVEYLRSYRAYREQQTNAIKGTQALLQKKIGSLEMSRKEKDEVLQKQQEEKQVLAEEKKEQDLVITKLKSRENELSKELSAKQKADNKLRASIKAAIDREIKLARAKALEEEKRIRAENAANAKVNAAGAKPAAETPKTDVAVVKKSGSVFDATPAGELISDNFEKNKGKLPWPIDKGNIKFNFGTYSIPGTKLNGNNPGLTLETEDGGPVKCIFDGEVASVFDIEGEYNVLIRHGKYFTTYGNLASSAVTKGQKVKAGQVLGKAGTNNDGNGEIEFLLLQENKNLDPASWIRRR
ncbi:MAG: peptidoglycan DD-metalloendopeptidase family protein [Chitinophagaceae bacterium]|nr:peptidoglycan DD-metalloendopeptidase family protein [Chitinophagaceae bacterium]